MGRVNTLGAETFASRKFRSQQVWRKKEKIEKFRVHKLLRLAKLSAPKVQSTVSWFQGVGGPNFKLVRSKN